MDGTPRLGHGFRFQWEPAQQAHVLLYPEGMVKLNQSAGEILKRCDGSRSSFGSLKSLVNVTVDAALRVSVIGSELLNWS